MPPKKKPPRRPLRLVDELPVRRNEAYVAALLDLADAAHKVGGTERMKATAYQKAAEAVMMLGRDVLTPDDLLRPKVPGVGNAVYSKLQELDETGAIKRLAEYREHPNNTLGRVYGVGPSRAEALTQRGIKTIEDLRERPELLPANSRVALRHLEDIEERIPRAEIAKFETTLSDLVAASLPPGTTAVIAGSYRRGAEASGDVDVIVSSADNKKAVLGQLLEALQETGVVDAVLTQGASKIHLIARLVPGGKARRVDLMYAPPAELAFALTYFTGSKTLNVVQRQRAKDMGLRLNEHGFYDAAKSGKAGRHPGVFPDEASIYAHLGMKYLEPHERKDRRSVVFLDTPASPKRSSPSKGKRS